MIDRITEMLNRLEEQEVPESSEIETLYNILTNDLYDTEPIPAHSVSGFLIRLAEVERRAGTAEKIIISKYYIILAAYGEFLDELSPYTDAIIARIEEDVMNDGSTDEEKIQAHMNGLALFNLIGFYSGGFDKRTVPGLNDADLEKLIKMTYLMYKYHEGEKRIQPHLAELTPAVMLYAAIKAGNDSEEALKYLYAAEASVEKTFTDIAERYPKAPETEHEELYSFGTDEKGSAKKNDKKSSKKSDGRKEKKNGKKNYDPEEDELFFETIDTDSSIEELFSDFISMDTHGDVDIGDESGIRETEREENKKTGKYGKDIAELICSIYEGIAYHIADDDPDSALDYYWRAIGNRERLEYYMEEPCTDIKMPERYDRLTAVCERLSLSAPDALRLADKYLSVMRLIEKRLPKREKTDNTELVPYIKASFELRKYCLQLAGKNKGGGINADKVFEVMGNEFSYLSRLYIGAGDKAAVVGLYREMYEIAVGQLRKKYSTRAALIIASCFYCRGLNVYDEKEMIYTVFAEMIYDRLRNELKDSREIEAMYKAVKRRRKMLQKLYGIRLYGIKELFTEELGKLPPGLLEKLPEKMSDIFNKKKPAPAYSLREALGAEGVPGFSALAAVSDLLYVRDVFAEKEEGTEFGLENFLELADRAREAAPDETIHRVLLMAARAEDKRGNSKTAFVIYCRIYSRFSSWIDIQEEAPVIERILELSRELKDKFPPDGEEMKTAEMLTDKVNGPI